MDILPACPNGGDGAIFVPDRKLECWKHSNPQGFADWFFKRCVLRDAIAERELKASVEPLPSAVPSEYKYPLRRLWRNSFRTAEARESIPTPRPAAVISEKVWRCCMIQLRREWGRFSNFSFRTPQRRIAAYPARPSG